MSSQKLLARCLLLLLVSTASSQQKQQQRFVVLPHAAGKVVNPKPLSDDTNLGTWAPSEAEIDGLEANLLQISGMKLKGWPSSMQIQHPDFYYRQYVGATANRKKLIFVNAFCQDPPPQTWKSQIYVVADGGTCFWQALYDPATKQFSNLTINGRG
jgi:hypothetical protein